ncbi:MAG: DEAD/DEAH box helicase family protein [Desulfovibrio sp.]|nr:DEAD/DEAH box helicase family protein [Desulfovibrio sp.]
MSPEKLYEAGKDAYLTIEEVSWFAHNLSEEVQHARQAKLSPGNRKKSPQAKDNKRGEKRRVQQFGLLNPGSLGTEQPGRTEEAGSPGRTGLRPEVVRSAEEGGTGPEQRSSPSDEFEWDERLGDIGEPGHRHEPQNYRISSEDQLGSGGAKTKYADNVAAIRLLKRLQESGTRAATPEEQKVLVRYVGWGGLPQAFDAKNEKWATEFRELQGLLSPDEYAAARRSTQDAHYTSEAVIRGIYDGLARMGLVTGEELRILEPSAGIGNFIGLCPEEFNARFMAVELDPTTSAIAQYLYPEARHINNGFHHSQLRGGGIDAVVGNPPFGKQSVYDPDYPELRRFSIHNYFLAKSIDLLREGGVAAFVVSRFFMDTLDQTAREHIAQQADFLGAIRLPETAFRQNALTDVTTDIVFFQKNTGERQNNREWLRTENILVDDLKHGGTELVPVNAYFAEHPEQIIGRMALAGGMFESALSCLPDPTQSDLGQEISKRLAVLPENIFVPREENPLSTTVRVRNENFISSEYFQSLKMNALCVEPHTGKVVFKTAADFGQSDYDILPVKSDTARSRLVAMIRIRDTLRELLDAEKADAEETHIASLRARLNSEYDTFVRKYGHLNSQINRSLMRVDPEHALLQSLEVEYDKGITPETARRQGREARPASAKKAAIFRQRVLQSVQVAEHADSPKDALLVSLRESGKIDFNRMGQLLNRSGEAVQGELQEQGLIFLNPVSEEWEIRDKYLTGNVRGKLHEAKTAAQDDKRYQANVEALTAAMPPDIEAVDIGIRFGSSWVPPQIFSDFIEHLHEGKGMQTVNYFPALGRWDVSVKIWDQSLNGSVWGIPEYPASRIIEALLTNKTIKVEKEIGEDKHGRPIKEVDQELTAAAMQKADAIKQNFLDWVWQDDDRREQLTTLYNERFNTHVPPHYDGSHIQLTGASEAVKLRPHQKNAVWRAIQEGTALFDHVVGAGKTMACIATIMESKRMGFVNKPMVVVPNYLLSQWKDEFYKLYPGANILVAGKDDFTKANRERLFSRIATGDWDAVIVAHSSFKKIDMPGEEEEVILKEQIDAAIEAIEYAKTETGNRTTVKQLEKMRDKMQERFDALKARTGTKDRSVDFADLGVDALFVDESHEFKNLAFQTGMQVSGMGNISGSGKALDLFVKCRYLQRKNDGRGVYFLTGTPISNTIAEVYTLQRYMQYDELKKKEIAHFDAWASTFGQITNNWELDATGVNYELKFLVLMDSN